MQSTAAPLTLGHHDVVAVAREHTHRSAIHVAEEFGHHAALEQSHSTSALALSRRKGGQPATSFRPRNPRQKPARISDKGKKHACDAVHAQSLGKPEQGKRRVQPSGESQNSAQRKALETIGPTLSQTGIGNRRPALFQHGSVLNSRRAFALTGSAAQAQAEFLGDHTPQFNLTFGCAPDQVDATPGRTVFASGDPIRGASTQTEPAMHAIEAVIEKARVQMKEGRGFAHLKFVQRSGRDSGSHPGRTALLWNASAPTPTRPRIHPNRLGPPRVGLRPPTGHPRPR